jgi:hypothetical protein
MKTAPILLLILGAIIVPCAAENEALENISKTVERIEAVYTDWPHFSAFGENLEGGNGFEQHVWFSDDDSGLFRAKEIYFGEHGIVSKTFYLKENALLHVVDRSENTPMEEGAATSVVEERCDFADGALIRYRVKEGTFEEGKDSDTSKLKNREIALDEVNGAAERHDDYRNSVVEIVSKLTPKEENGKAEANPPGTGITQGSGWRLIEGSRSRDGTYGIAWGIQGQEVPKGETDEDGFIAAEPEAEGITNYIVNLRTGAILGKTAGSHFGDKSSYNHYTNDVSWSASSGFVAQVCSGKWATFDANLYELQAGGEQLSPAADMLGPAQKAAFEHMGGGDFFKKFDRDSFTITLSDARIMWRGGKPHLAVEVTGGIPKSEDEGAYFGVTVTFAIVSDENGGAPTLSWSGSEAHPE